MFSVDLIFCLFPDYRREIINMFIYLNKYCKFMFCNDDLLGKDILRN